MAAKAKAKETFGADSINRAVKITQWSLRNLKSKTT
jgi:hypothetical protein